MSLITVEYVPRGWLWVAPTQPTMGYIALGELACQFITLDSCIDFMIDYIACIDENATGPVSPPPRY